MANVLEYIISLKDKVSVTTDKINASVKNLKNNVDKVSTNARTMQQKMTKAFGAIYSKAKDAVKGPKKLTSSINDLQRRLEEVNRVKFGTQLKSEFKSATAEANKLQKKINHLQQGISGHGVGSKLKGWRKSFASNLPGAALLSNPITLASAGIAGAWKSVQSAMKAGKEKTQLQVLAGSKDIGNTLYKGLTKYATDTVFGDELYGMASTMMANGIKSSNVMPVMKQLGDISMGDSNKLGQLSLAFAQVKGKGHLAGQELLQLINAGFNPLQVISEHTGESMSSLKQKMAKGMIGVKDVRKAMKMATGSGGKFHNMLDKIANTPYGKLENLRGQMSQMMIKIGQVFLPIASKMMDFFSWMGEKLGPYIKPIVAIIGALAAGLLIAAAAQWVLNSALFASPLTWIIVAIVAIIAIITYLIMKLDGWGNAWHNLMTGLKMSFNAFVADFKLLWMHTTDYFMDGIELIEKGWYKVKALWDKDGAQKGLQRLNDDAKTRADEIAKQKKVRNDYVIKSAAAFDNVFGKKGLHFNNTSISDVKDKIQAKLGIKAPNAAGAKNGGANGGANAAGTQTNSAIATGGTKNTTINISFKNMVEQMKIEGGSFKEATSKMEEQLTDAIARVLAMASTTAG